MSKVRSLRTGYKIGVLGVGERLDPTIVPVQVEYNRNWNQGEGSEDEKKI